MLEWKQILDTPNKRKIHHVKTPSMGGIPIFCGALFALLIWFDLADGTEQKYLFSALTIFFIIGLRDDLIPMRPRFKLLSQLIPILMVVIFSDIRLTSLYSLYNVELGLALSIGLSIFTLIVVTNSFNLIDGIDGLSGTVGSIILVSLGLWFFLTDNFHFSFICFSFLGGLLAFLIYNWSPSRIFMGDTGALLLGFLIGCLSIHFINTNFHLEKESIYRFKGSISAIICILIIPLIDTLRVFVLRISNKQSPLIADNNHIHHALIDLGLGHSKATLILAAVNLLFIGVAFVGKNVSDPIMLLIIALLAASLLAVLSFLSNRKSQTQKGTI